MELEYQVIGNKRPSKRNMDLPKFKRRRVSAVRDYPLQFTVNLRKEQDVAHVRPYACWPVSKKYPPLKIRKGVTVTRDFPVKLNVPTALRNQISNSKGSSSDDGMPMQDCKRLDAFNAANFCASTDAKPSNTSIASHSESLLAPIATDAHDILACIKYKGDDIVDYKPMPSSIHDSRACIESEKEGVEESSWLMNIEDEQREVGVPIANNIYTCTSVRDSNPPNVPNAIDVCDSHVSIKPENEGVEESNLLMDIGLEQCQAGDYQVTHEESRNAASLAKGVRLTMVVAGEVNHEIHECIQPKKEGAEETSLLMNTRDEHRQAVVFSLGDYQVAHEESQDPTSLTKGVSSSTSVANERCLSSLFLVHDFKETFNDEEECVKLHDNRATFKDDEECVTVTSTSTEVNGSQDDEECVIVTSTKVNGSQVCPSNDEVITNNELSNDRDKVKRIISLFKEVCDELERDNIRKSKIGFTYEAASILRKRHKWIKRDKYLGPVPGIEVGDHFDSRVELNIVGLHCRNVHGIDYKKLDEKNLAISIVDSGRYHNVFESNEGEFLDTLIYLGEGENPKLKGNKTIEDQKLRGGNLALKNSAEVKNPVRVIRKFTYKCGKIEKRKYFYDGLYFVDGYQQEMASSGKLVFKFLLKKLPGQPKLDWIEVKKLVCMNRICGGKERTPVRVMNILDDEKPLVFNYVIDDISQGKERIPIRAVNALDDEKLPIFNYVTNVTHPESYRSVIDDGCDCIDGCSDSEDCPCVLKNGGSSYNYEELIIKKKPFIIECGPSCKCYSSCLNRVSQRGIRFPLEVFKTKTKGWGVRSRSFIRRGSFICEYVGEIILDNEGEQRVGKDEYLFDIGINDDLSLQESNSLDPSEGDECFTIDAARVGNVGRFINHSCSPNLYPQSVLFDHDKKRMPHIMFFAMEDILPMEELTYDYNYEIDGVCDAKGNIKIKACYCGSNECIGRMY
ncbi:hypothetical protein V6N11_059459 [Hibiscus sabdariffa]|uniref:Uncharacterized protein n=1 Tax=Hibiscus sabdariffa TaxID=183260 RepID=A0ABR1ZU76_9ROSI